VVTRRPERPPSDEHPAAARSGRPRTSTLLPAGSAAERAVQGCPRKALWIESVEVAATHARGGTAAR